MAPTLEIFENTTETNATKTTKHIFSPIVILHHHEFTTTTPSIPLPKHEGDKVTVKPDEYGSVTVNGCEVDTFTFEYPDKLSKSSTSREAILSQL